MGFLQEFKEFAVKGNALDMAVGIILGAAFNKIVNSIVADIIMPPLGLAISGVDFREMQFVLKDAIVDASGKETAAAVAIRHGAFLNTIFEFIIVAFSVFCIVKFMNSVILRRDMAAAKK